MHPDLAEEIKAILEAMKYYKGGLVDKPIGGGGKNNGDGSSPFNVVNFEIKEHRIQPSMGVCLRGKREAERQYSETVTYKCIKN